MRKQSDKFRLWMGYPTGQVDRTPQKSQCHLKNLKGGEFLISNYEGQKKLAGHFVNAKEKNCQTRIMYPAKINYKNERKIEKFSGES